MDNSKCTLGPAWCQTAKKTAREPDNQVAWQWDFRENPPKKRKLKIVMHARMTQIQKQIRDSGDSFELAKSNVRNKLKTAAKM